MSGLPTVELSPGSCFRPPPLSSSISFSLKPFVLPMRHFHRTRRFPKLYALSSNDIKVGSNIEVDGAPWRVMEFLHVKPGKGAAFVRTTLRNYKTGNTVEKTFRAGSKIDEADIVKETKQYTYKDAAQYVFMDLMAAKNMGQRLDALEEFIGTLKEEIQNMTQRMDQILKIQEESARIASSSSSGRVTEAVALSPMVGGSHAADGHNHYSGSHLDFRFRKLELLVFDGINPNGGQQLARWWWPGGWL